MKNLKYSVIFKPETQGGFTAIVPALPGCVTYGKTIEEAQKMVLDAIKGYLKSLEKHHEAIPNDETLLISMINIPQTYGQVACS